MLSQVGCDYVFEHICVLHISRARQQIHSQYTLHGEILESVDCARYFDVSITKDLSWNTHINKITSKANRTLGFRLRFSFAPVFQWCCSTPQGSPGVGHNALFLSSPHLCFIIVFICDLFVSHDDPLMGKKTFTRTEQLYVLSHDRSRGRGWDPVKPV